MARLKTRTYVSLLCLFGLHVHFVTCQVQMFDVSIEDLIAGMLVYITLLLTCVLLYRRRGAANTVIASDEDVRYISEVTYSKSGTRGPKSNSGISLRQSAHKDMDEIFQKAPRNRADTTFMDFMAMELKKKGSQMTGQTSPKAKESKTNPFFDEQISHYSSQVERDEDGGLVLNEMSETFIKSDHFNNSLMSGTHVVVSSDTDYNKDTDGKSINKLKMISPSKSTNEVRGNRSSTGTSRITDSSISVKAGKSKSSMKEEVSSVGRNKAPVKGSSSTKSMFNKFQATKKK